MYLINVHTYELGSFETDPPPYAILSHRWRNEEVTFQDFQDAAKREKKKGFAKILAMCDMAKKDQLHWAWVDTCCINKSSSAELSEAINSMFKWYKGSVVCYVYLDDVTALDGKGYLDDVIALDQAKFDSDNIYQTKGIKKSEWFERGWTLQEVIAPNEVKFYNSRWNLLGSKKDLADRLSQVTNIDAALLQGRAFLEWFSVARRMSWAAKRKTTRKEDAAYCLLGLFGINMPLLYGEGSKAFLRLQEKIAKNIDDQTIFAWQDRSGRDVYRGMFASSPEEFASSKDLVKLWGLTIPNHIDVTVRGLRTKTTVCPTSEIEAEIGLSTVSYLLLPLNFRSLKSIERQDMFAAILLVWQGDNRYLRAKPDQLFEVQKNQISRDTTIFIDKDNWKPTNLYLEYPILSETLNRFFIQLPDEGITLLDTSPTPGYYDHSRSTFFIEEAPNLWKDLRTGRRLNFLCGLAFHVGDGQVFLVAIEFSTYTTVSGPVIRHKMTPHFINSEAGDPNLSALCREKLSIHSNSTVTKPLDDPCGPMVTRDLTMADSKKPGSDRLRISLQQAMTRPDGLYCILRLCFIRSRSWTSKGHTYNKEDRKVGNRSPMDHGRCKAKL